MTLKVVRFASLLLTALALCGAFGHLLEMPNKLALGREEYLFVQQRLYEGWGSVLGPVEAGALISTLLVVVLVRRHRGRVLLWTLLATVLIAAALVVWQVWVGPVNAEVDAWTAASMPADWEGLRNSWEYGHAARAVLFAGAFASLLVAALGDTPSEPESKSIR